MAAAESTLSLRHKLGFGLGHIQNDLVGSIWFTYLLLYYHEVLKFDNTYAGIILLAGQISDSISTVFVGYFADKDDNFILCRIFNRRKAWHVFGTICVVVLCPFIFLKCVGCSDSSDHAQLFYYIMIANIVQFGWGAVQISHLSMITELTPCPSQRTGLTAIRNAATVLSNIFLYLVAWYFLGSKEGDEADRIGPEDDDAFRYIVLVCLGTGTLTTFLFYILVQQKDTTAAIDYLEDDRQPLILNKKAGQKIERKKGVQHVEDLLVVPEAEEVLSNYPDFPEVERSYQNDVPPPPMPRDVRVVRYSFAEIIESERQHDEERETEYLYDFDEVLECEREKIRSSERRKQMTLRRWFKQPQLYQVTIIYLTTRLFTNLSQVYIPLYLQVTLKLQATSVATVPLVTYISGFIASLVLERGKFIFRKRDAFYAGSIMGLIGCIWVHFGSPLDEDYTTKQIYGVAVLMGFGSSVMMVTSLALTADFIGGNVESSAFVYGFMSLTDKTCNGVAVVLIQNFIPEPDSPFYKEYFSSALSWGCGAAVLVGLATLLSLWSTVIGTRKLSQTAQSMSNEPSDYTPLMMGENRRK